MATKVLMLGWELPPFNSGGLGVACLGLSKALCDKGAEITFVLPTKQDVPYDFMKILFANIDDNNLLLKSTYSSIDKWLLGETEDPFPSDYVRAAMKYAHKVKLLVKKLGADSIDVIHAHDWMTYQAAVAAKKILGRPLVVHIHNTVFDRCGGFSNPYEYRIEKDGFENADKIISVSQLTKNILVEKYGVSENKVEVVHNGISNPHKDRVPPALLPLKKLGYKVVLFLGRITLQKGLDYLVKAAQKVLQYDPKVVFVVTGSGDMQEQMMSETIHMGVSDNFIFTGFLRGEEKDQIYQAADLFIMPSVSEPFGVVALEAASHGVPVLVSKQSGVSEVLRHSLKVDFWDVDEMANEIYAVLNYKGLGTDLKKESAKEVVNINWNTAADKCINVYNQLTHKN